MAGFQMEPVAKAEELARPRTLEPRNVVQDRRDGQISYVYNDPACGRTGEHDRVPMVSVALALILWVGLAERMIGMRSMVVLGAVLIALCGCAATERHEAHDAEQVLSAAGFYMKLSDTPKTLANLRTLYRRESSCRTSGTASCTTLR
jgi:hypothetical protein